MKLLWAFFFIFTLTLQQSSFAKKEAPQSPAKYRVISRKGKPLSDRQMPEYNKRMLGIQGKRAPIQTTAKSRPIKNANKNDLPPKQNSQEEELSKASPRKPGFQSLDSINFNESLNAPTAKEIILNQQNIAPEANPKKNFRPPQKDYFIKAGVFTKQIEARSVAKTLSLSLKMPIEPEFIASKNQYVINIGPFSERRDAEIILASIINTGYSDVEITER